MQDNLNKAHYMVLFSDSRNLSFTKKKMEFYKPKLDEKINVY